uniref:Link domain-containing protein n=1 Tax=Amphiprion percula TaxID=161767 RepID=A0A3P8U842_AMPPE
NFLQLFVMLTCSGPSENTAGVFHLRSPEGKYKMNFSRAAASCQEEDATLATVQQLGDAQQLGMHLCVAGWLDGGKVGYPTRFPSVRCGDNHVGLVMYKDPVDQSNPYDAYCYRLRGTGAAHLLTPVHYLFNTSLTPVQHNTQLITTFSLTFWRCTATSPCSTSGSSSEGRELLDFLSHRMSEVTLFVPHNAGFSQNQVRFFPSGTQTFKKALVCENKVF